MEHSHSNWSVKTMLINGSSIQSSTWRSGEENRPCFALSIHEGRFSFQVSLTSEQARRLALNLVESAEQFDNMQNQPIQVTA